MKESPVILTLTQDSDPRESCLCSLKGDEFEKLRIIMDRYSPLFIMVSDIEWVISTPSTAN